MSLRQITIGAILLVAFCTGLYFWGEWQKQKFDMHFWCNNVSRLRLTLSIIDRGGLHFFTFFLLFLL